jgi:hypothetical protein
MAYTDVISPPKAVIHVDVPENSIELIVVYIRTALPFPPGLTKSLVVFYGVRKLSVSINP